MNVRDASRKDYSPPADGQVGWGHIQTGAFQRIADALERIADLMDPVKRSEIEKKARKLADSDECHRLWIESLGVLERKLEALCPQGAKEKEAVKRLMCGWLWKNRPRRDCDVAAYEHFSAKVDALEISSMLAGAKLGPKSRERLDAMLARTAAQEGR